MDVMYLVRQITSRTASNHSLCGQDIILVEPTKERRGEGNKEGKRKNKEKRKVKGPYSTLQKKIEAVVFFFYPVDSGAAYQSKF